MGISNSNDSFDEESSAIAMIENSKEKRMYIIKGTPCIICNAKYGEQCKNELADEKCRSRFVRLEVQGGQEAMIVVLGFGYWHWYFI